MKNTLAIFGQVFLFALLLAIFVGGSFLGLFHLDPFHTPHWFTKHLSPTSIEYFVPSGMILMTIVFAIIASFEAASKGLRSLVKWTTVAYLAALLIGFLAKFGWVHTDLY
jgi:hypothetical protein